MGILPSRHFDVRMTSYKNFIVDFGLRIQKYPPGPNLSKIKPISWKICKFLHFSIPRHIHNRRLPWQHLRLMTIVIMCKMAPLRVGLNLENFILISCAVLELLRNVSQGGADSAPPGEIGLNVINLRHNRCDKNKIVIMLRSNKSVFKNADLLQKFARKSKMPR